MVGPAPQMDFVWSDFADRELAAWWPSDFDTDEIVRVMAAKFAYRFNAQQLGQRAATLKLGPRPDSTQYRARDPAPPLRPSGRPVEEYSDAALEGYFARHQTVVSMAAAFGKTEDWIIARIKSLGLAQKYREARRTHMSGN